MRRAIGRQERDALRSIASGWLDDWIQIGTLLRGDKVEEALAERRKFERLFRLLDDLGWAETDPRDRYESTMPDADLSSLLDAFRDEAIDMFKCDVEAGNGDWCEEDLNTRWVCNAVLEEAK